jgi:hypothetical protein
MLSLVDLERANNGPIPPAVLAAARFGSHEMVALMRARGETAFFRSMMIGQLKTIRMRRADGTYYPALLTDLQFYRQQFRSWNRIAAELGRAVGVRDLFPAQLSKMTPTAREAGSAPDRVRKGNP